MTLTAELRANALRCAAAVDPAVLTGDQAAAAVRDLATVEKAAATTRMFLALRVAKTNAWQGQGHKTAADWLSAQLGISVHEAARQLGTARKAEALPKTKERMREGKLSPNEANAVTDAATADPGAEEDLLDLAERATNRDLHDEAARRRAAATDDAARERRIHRERSKRTWVDRDGAWNLRLRGPAADGVRFEEALRPFTEQAFRTGRSDGVRDTFDNREYDATLALCGIRPLDGTPSTSPVAPAPAPEPGGGSGEPAGPTPAPGASPPAKRPGGSNVKVIVRIDHTALVRGRTVAGETCEVAGLGPISVAAAEDLMGDAFLAAVITKGRDVVNVAHLGRAPNAYQRTALQATSTACQNICCNRTVNIQIDHRVPYAVDQITKLDNLDPLCTGNGGCHDLKTHHGHELEAGAGRRRLLPLSHPDHPRSRRAPEPEAAHPPAPSSATGPPAQVTQPTLC